MKYLTEFKQKVKGEPPNRKIFEKYLDGGSEYLADMSFSGLTPIAIEERYSFTLGGKSFVGIVDMVCEDDDGHLIIVDHKSHQLKPRSGRKKPTKGDQELDEYLRQLYLYCIPVKKKFGRYPDKLAFNCFRNDKESQFIVEEFSEEAFEAAKKWAIDSIEETRQEENWDPVEEFWKCAHICGLHDRCETWLEGRA